MAPASLLYNYGGTQRWWGRVLPGMKVLISIVIGLLVVGCEPPKPPDISIHIAAGTGNIKDVKQHLAAGTDVNAKRNNGATPLHEAAAFGHKEIAELLIAAGADVDAKDENGYRSEEHTSELQSQAYLVCRLLLEKKNTTKIH